MKMCISCKLDGFADSKAVADHILELPDVHSGNARAWAVSYLDRLPLSNEKSPCMVNTEAPVLSSVPLSDLLSPPPARVNLPGISFLVYWHWDKPVEWVPA